MAKIKDAILSSGEAFAGHSPALNPLYGGQQGIYPRYGAYIDGKFSAEWINNTPYVSVPVIPILLETPKFFKFLPFEKEMIAMSKALLEVHPKSIDGLDSTISVEVEEIDIGRGNNKHHVYTNVKKAQSNPTFTWVEKLGRPITKWLDFIIMTGMMDPETGFPKLTKYLTNKNDASEYDGIYTPDFTTFTMLFIEPDIMHCNVEKAWLCSNMFPHGSGETKGSRVLTDNGSTLEITVEFGGITQDHYNVGVMSLAKAMLSKIYTLNEISDLDMTIPVASRNPTLESEEISHSIEKVQGGNGDMATVDPFPAKGD